ncbi:hypothetical protein LCGC14_0737700 [marine sediment metagenome]|uniref:Uncharacterized protein n=1 Tax=marine sediment metagenome TaxID=412755 RepID=A0A0F9QBS5_9ZZZZ
MLKIYLPIQVNPFDNSAFTRTLLVGLICGIVGTIGLIVAKK